MIGISKLYLGAVEPSDLLRYGGKSKELPSRLLQFSADKKPVIVWNSTKTCNLKCVHCYARASAENYEDELSTDEAKKMMEDLASYGTPVLLFSGGEPLLRKDFFELAAYAKKSGMRTVVSTNGALITKEAAKELKKTGLSYVGISIDGINETNDKFRGVEGAFKKAIEGIKNCKENGLKVGLRFTISKRNVKDIPGIFKLLIEEEIQRVCFYHLVYSGRGSELMKEVLSNEDTRKTVDLIIDAARKLSEKGLTKEVLTVDNHADGVYLYLRMKRENNPRADDALKLLKMNGGNSAGIGIGCISWDGEVYADQFLRSYSFGNIRKRKFGEIWEDISEPLMAKLKNRKPYLKGKCAKCKWLDICNGNFRARAEAKTGDIWQPDPACYLSDAEIGISCS